MFSPHDQLQKFNMGLKQKWFLATVSVSFKNVIVIWNLLEVSQTQEIGDTTVLINQQWKKILKITKSMSVQQLDKDL
jgi:hypothetical protein